jgi:hypothetical protein
MVNIHKIGCFVLALAGSISVARGQVSRVRSTILAEDVSTAIKLAGVDVGPEQVEFLSGTHGLSGSKASESTSVRVVSMARETADKIKVKLRCQDNHDCLPFYVLVHGVDYENPKTPKANPAAAAAEALHRNVIRGGDHATLVLENVRARMSFPVICMESGAPGQKIRVSSPDHKQFYQAEVVAAGTLKGNL